MCEQERNQMPGHTESRETTASFWNFFCISIMMSFIGRENLAKKLMIFCYHFSF